MPLFNLASIDFGTDRSGTNLDSTGFSNSFMERKGKGYNIHRYPIDLGNYDKGHYVLFHINEQTQTSFSGGTVGEEPTIIANESKTGLTRTSASSSLSGGSLTIDVDIGTNPILFRRPIRRTKDTIALYMPDTILYNFNQSYSETPTTGMMAGFLSAMRSAVDGYKSNEYKGAFNNLTPFLKSGAFEIAKNFFSSQAGFIGAGQQQTLGFVQNPSLEMLYSSPKMRTFSFEFNFYPRSEKEAKDVQKILQLLRFHQAPEILQNSAGFFLVPPSEFDIKFYYNGKENPNVPAISTCVLENMTVDYAPNGWAAYEDAASYNGLIPRIGQTGMPVAIRLSLQFRETEIVTKQFIKATEDQPFDATQDWWA